MAVAMPIVDAAALFRDAGLKVVETGLEHGTVTVVADGEAIEVTQTRVDLDTDGRHATVAFSDDWRADAARRDFTVNALYVTADGAVEDPLDARTKIWMPAGCGSWERQPAVSKKMPFACFAIAGFCRDSMVAGSMPKRWRRFRWRHTSPRACLVNVLPVRCAACLAGRWADRLRVMEETGLTLQALGVSTQSDRLTPANRSPCRHGRRRQRGCVACQACRDHASVIGCDAFGSASPVPPRAGNARQATWSLRKPNSQS